MRDPRTAKRACGGKMQITVSFARSTLRWRALLLDDNSYSKLARNDEIRDGSNGSLSDSNHGQLYVLRVTTVLQFWIAC